MKKHLRTELIRCKDCGYEFWSAYLCSHSNILLLPREPVCGKCGSVNVEHIGYRE